QRVRGRVAAAGAAARFEADVLGEAALVGRARFRGDEANRRRRVPGPVRLVGDDRLRSERAADRDVAGFGLKVLFFVLAAGCVGERGAAEEVGFAAQRPVEEGEAEVFRGR